MTTQTDRFDLSDLKEATQRRREARREFRKVVESTPRSEIDRAWDEDKLTVEMYQLALRMKGQQERRDGIS